MSDADNEQLRPPPSWDKFDEICADFFAHQAALDLGPGKFRVLRRQGRQRREGRDNAPIYANLFDDEGGEGYTLL